MRGKVAYEVTKKGELKDFNWRK